LSKNVFEVSEDLRAELHSRLCAQLAGQAREEQQQQQPLRDSRIPSILWKIAVLGQFVAALRVHLTQR
jgi:hypothetical protein